MKQRTVLERDAALNHLGIGYWPQGRPLNVTLVYHDDRTHAWAEELFERLTKAAGSDALRATWWKISDLIEPGVLAGAVSTAMRADVIVVAFDAAERLPVPAHVWVDTWLPNRPAATGCLVGLIGTSGHANGELKSAREYLRAVAREGHLALLLEERRLPVEPQPLPRRAIRFSRPNLHPVELGTLVGAGSRVSHWAA